MAVPRGLGEALENTVTGWSAGCGCAFRLIQAPPGHRMAGELLIVCRHGVNIPARQASAYIEGQSTLGVLDLKTGLRRELGAGSMRLAHDAAAAEAGRAHG